MNDAPTNEEEDDDEGEQLQQQYRKYQTRRSSRENGWLSDEVVTMIDESPSSIMGDGDARWRRGSSTINDEKESTI